MDQTLVYTILVAISFGTWPIITRFGKVPMIWTAILVNLGTVIAAVVYYFIKGETSANPKVILVGILAGLINGVGFLIYSNLLSNPNLSVSTVVTVLDITIPIISVILGLMFLNESISIYKVIGMIVSFIGIFLILKK